MKDLNEILNNIFKEELPYIMIGLSKYKTTKIALPKVFEGQNYVYGNMSYIYYDKPTHTIHHLGRSNSINLKDCLGFQGNIFIDKFGNGYSFNPLFEHKHINQDLLIEFINIIKDYIEIRNKYINLFRGENYSLNNISRYDYNDPFKNSLTIYKDKEIVFCHALNENEYILRKKLIIESGYQDLIFSLYSSFESIIDEYYKLYNRIQDITSTYKLLENL